MKIKTKEILKVFIMWTVIFLLVLTIFLIIKKIQNKVLVEKVTKTYIANIDIQIEEKNETKENIIMQINGNSIIGVLRIDKINFEGLVYEGTNEKVLRKGVGHFEQSPVIEGNACFAAHNYLGFWAKLHTLKVGDSISYISYLGTKEYQVFNMKEIDETDWSLLQNTDENIITLITCIKNKPEKRICVQAKEKI